jgi:hypothetical protein
MTKLVDVISRWMDTFVSLMAYGIRLLISEWYDNVSGNTSCPLILPLFKSVATNILWERGPWSRLRMIHCESTFSRLVSSSSCSVFQTPIVQKPLEFLKFGEMFHD